MNAKLVKVNILTPDFLPQIKKRSFYIPIVDISQDEVIGKTICEAELADRRVPIICSKKNKLFVNFDISKTLEIILNENLFKQKQPIYAKLPFHYHHIPGSLREKIGSLLYKGSSLTFVKDKSVYPDWPIDYSAYFIKCVMELSDTKKSLFKNIKLPRSKKFVLCLTHDADDYDGFKKIKEFVNIEKEFGVRSTFYIPAFHYKIDFDFLASIEQEGFEIGIHGFNHQGRLPFEGRKEINRKIKMCFEKFKPWVKVTGFRSPAYLRTPELMEGLEKYFVYDSSSPDSLNFKLSESYNGCSSAYIFQKGKLLEMPVSMPDDGTLLMLKFKPKQILQIWLEKLAYIKSVGGVAVFLNHPDPHFSGNEQMLKLYRLFLKKATADRSCLITTCQTLVIKASTQR